MQPPTGLKVLKLIKALEAEVQTLRDEKQNRLARAKELRTRDQHLCDVLCATPFYIPSGAVPSQDQLQALSDHIHNLEKEKVAFCFSL